MSSSNMPSTRSDSLPSLFPTLYKKKTKQERKTKYKNIKELFQCHHTRDELRKEKLFFLLDGVVFGSVEYESFYVYGIARIHPIIRAQGVFFKGEGRGFDLPYIVMTHFPIRFDHMKKDEKFGIDGDCNFVEIDVLQSEIQFPIDYEIVTDLPDVEFAESIPLFLWF